MRHLAILSALLLVLSTSADARHYHRHYTPPSGRAASTQSALEALRIHVASHAVDEEVKPLAIKRVLRTRRSGQDVWLLQRSLIALGYDLGPTGDDGRFGRRTRRAVVAFQVANDLPPTGVVNDATLMALRGQKTDNEVVQVFDAINMEGPRASQRSESIHSDRGAQFSTIRHAHRSERALRFEREPRVINYNAYRAPNEVALPPHHEVIRVASTGSTSGRPHYPRLRERFVPESDHTPKWNNPGALRPASCVTWGGVVGLNSSNYVCFESNVWGAAAVIETIVRQYRSGRFRTPRQLFEHWTETVGDRDSYGATVGRKLGCGAHGDAGLVERGTINKDRVIVMAMSICQFEHGQRRGHLPREVFEEGFRLQFGF